MNKIKTIKQTSCACPAQWEGEFEDGTPFFIRYRWGYLSIRKGVKGDGVDSAIEGEEIFWEKCGNKLDGLIGLKKVLKLSGITYV